MSSVLLLFLSIFNVRSEEAEYEYGEDSFKGTLTNDAPVKALLKEAKDNHDNIDKVFCIVSKEVFEKKFETDTNDKNKKETTFERFERIIKEYATGELEYTNEELEVIPVFYDFEIGNDNNIINDNERSIYIYNQIVENLKQKDNEKTSFYVDYTGGFRDVSFFMTVIIRYLEFKNIKCKKIVYSKTPSQNDKFKENGKIIDIYYIYDMFKMINGVNEFLTSGYSAKLIDAIEKTKDNKKYSAANELLKSIIDFSNDISLCSVKRIDNSIANLQEKLEEFKKEKDQKKKDKDIIIEMFYTFIPLIEEKMNINEEGKITYPELIRWCLNARMIQQAITIYTEKMPEYYIDKKLIPKEILLIKEEDKSKAEIFYEYLYEHYNPEIKIKNLNDIFNEYKEKVAKGEFGEAKKAIKDTEITNKLLLDEKQIEKGFEKLGKIKKWYKKFEKTGTTPPKREVEGILIEPKKYVGFVNALANGLYLKQLFEISEDTNKSSRNKTWDKKIASLKCLEESNENPELLKKMQYYLAIKIIRNRINHASEKEIEKKEKEAIEYLKTKEIELFDTNNVLSIEKIVKVIEEGINLKS